MWWRALSSEQRGLLRALLIGATALVLCYVGTYAVPMPEAAGSFWRMKGLFDMSGEANIPAWYSSMLLALAGAAAYWCGRLSRDRRDRAAWMAAGAVFVLMSCDEVAMLHEAAIRFLNRTVVARLGLDGFGGWSYLILLGPIVLLVAVVLGRALRRSLAPSPAAARLLLLGLTVFFVGAIGLEGPGQAFNRAGVEWAGEVIGTSEEFMEMLGSILMVAGLLVHQGALKARRA